MDIQKVKEIVVPILVRYGVSQASLFGSIVMGNMNRESDIDILVEMPKKASLFDTLRVKVSLEEALGRKVDLVSFRGIKPAFRETILQTQAPLLLI